MNVLLGKLGVLELYKDGDYRPYVCCETVSMNFTKTKISVKTIGDGDNARSKDQTKSASISLSGLIPYDNDVDVTWFDLLAYHQQSVEILFQLVFQSGTGTVYKIIKGTASVDTAGIESAQDFVNGTLELTLQGPYEVKDARDVCNKAITNATFYVDADGLHVAILTLNSGSVPRYDYRIDGGPIDTSRDTGWTVPGIGSGHTIEIWPVCENGIYGTKYTHAF